MVASNVCAFSIMAQTWTAIGVNYLIPMACRRGGSSGHPSDLYTEMGRQSEIMGVASNMQRWVGGGGSGHLLDFHKEMSIQTKI